MATVATAVGAMAGMAEKRDLYFGRTTILHPPSPSLEESMLVLEVMTKMGSAPSRHLDQSDRQTDRRTSGPRQCLSYKVYVTS